MQNTGQSAAIEVMMIIPIIVGSTIVLIFLIPKYSYSAGAEINTFQLQAKAQSILNYITSNPGDPVNWGLNASGLLSFGLSLPNQPLNLDPYKVLALAYWDYANGVASGAVCSVNQTSGGGMQNYLSQYGITTLYMTSNFLMTPTPPGPTWLINYTRVKTSLGLVNYEFQLTIFPVLNVTVTPPASCGSNTCFKVVVSRFDTGQPMPNATVIVNYIAVVVSGSSVLQANGTLSGITSRNGTAWFSINLPYGSSNFYYINAYASVGGLGDHGIYITSVRTPLLTAIILPYVGGYNNIVFAHPHLFTQCLSGYSNPGQTALGLRMTAIFKSIYGYTFESINFTLNPGRGSGSYPVPCSSLASSNGNSNSACYWTLPQAPMLLLAYVTRNSQGQSSDVPISQLLVIPYGIAPELYLTNRVIIFGKRISYAPTATAQTIAYVGDSAYFVKLSLYYGGNVFDAVR